MLFFNKKNLSSLYFFYSYLLCQPFGLLTSNVRRTLIEFFSLPSVLVIPTDLHKQSAPSAENDKPVKVPRLILQTEDEHLAWAHGEERRRIRNQRKADKLDGI